MAVDPRKISALVGGKPSMSNPRIDAIIVASKGIRAQLTDFQQKWASVFKNPDKQMQATQYSKQIKYSEGRLKKNERLWMRETNSANIPDVFKKPINGW